MLILKTQDASTFSTKVRDNSGFSLIELLITLSIVAILALVVTPSFTSQTSKNDAKAVIQRLSGLVRVARNHAIYHQKNTIMCPSHDGQTCSQRWQDGALVFQDNNDNKLPDANESVVRFNAPLSDKGTLNWTANRNYLTFSGQGLTGSSAGSFIYCPGDNNSKHAHALIISFSGKIRHAQDSNKDGIRESGNAQNIVCS